MPAPLVMVRSIDLRKTKTGKTFASLVVCQASEDGLSEIDAKVWDFEHALESGLSAPASGDVIEILKLKTDEYQGKPQWILNDWRVLEGEEREAQLSGFAPSCKIDQEFYRSRLEALIDRTPAERACGEVLRNIFDWPGFREAFYQGPAARGHHQSYPGGLLEHTINVTTLALSLADAYGAPGHPGLSFNSGQLPIDRELLICAGLLHDIGKLDTYVLQPLAEVTDANYWEGHLAIGYATVRSQVQSLLESPPYPGAVDELNKLLHCILSHHGILEYGSPVEPACVEAVLLSQADITDARLSGIYEGAIEELGRNPNARWLRGLFHHRAGMFVGDWPTDNNKEG